MAVVDNKIVRFRGDTYPVKVGLSVDGVLLDLSGSTVTMSIKRDADTRTITGTSISETNYNVKFDFADADVETAGRFSYDIQVDDGSSKRTFVKEIFELIDDVTK